MDVLAVDLLLLRSLQTPELRLTPGRALMARVMRADGSGRGALNIAGAVIEAELPKHIRAGQELRLLVRSVTADQVMLSLSHDTPVAQPPALPAVPLPGGGTIRITEHEEHDRAGAGKATGDGGHTLTIQYDAPALGRLDLRFELDPATLQLTVTVPVGEALEQAQDGRDALQRALGDNADRTVSVKIASRRQPLDLYA
jgi:hypothetical protein